MGLNPDGGGAPYTAPSALMDVIEQFREKSLPTPFTAEILVRAGVSEGLAARTLQSLKQLDLVDEAGEPTEALNALRLAGTDDFKTRLEEVIRAAYAPIFGFVDPAKDPPERVRDAFRPYTPIGQQSRMVTLFLGLCAESGITPSDAPPRKKTSGEPSRKARRSPAGQKIEAPRRRARPGAVPGPIEALMHELPAPGGSWSKDQHDKFIETLEALLAFHYDVTDSDAEEGG